MRQEPIGTAISTRFHDLGMADPTEGEFHKNLSWFQWWDFEIHDFQRMSQFDQNRGGSLHR
jgi:hypothetical protein